MKPFSLVLFDKQEVRSTKFQLDTYVTNSRFKKLGLVLDIWGYITIKRLLYILLWGQAFNNFAGNVLQKRKKNHSLNLLRKIWNLSFLRWYSKITLIQKKIFSKNRMKNGNFLKNFQMWVLELPVPIIRFSFPTYFSCFKMRQS